MIKLIFSIATCFLVSSMAIAQSWVSFTKTTPEACKSSA